MLKAFNICHCCVDPTESLHHSCEYEKQNATDTTKLPRKIRSRAFVEVNNYIVSWASQSISVASSGKLLFESFTINLAVLNSNCFKIF